jgi:hypothetical protein
MEIVYRAHDGEEFKTEEECLAYEEAEIRVSNLIKSLRAADMKGNLIDLAKDPDSAGYVYIPNKESLTAFIKWQDDLGYITDGLDEDGKVGVTYAYDDRKDKWYCLNDRIKELNTVANPLSD